MLRIANLLVVIVLFNLTHAFAASDSAAIGLTVVIRPAVSLTMQGTSAVGVKIRLAPQTQARLWKADECAGLPANAHVIQASGIYSVSLSEMQGQGTKACLASSDGVLAAAIPLPPTVQ